MTHAELYDIVKDHPDVWGEVYRYSEHFSAIFPRDISVETSPEAASVGLIGLGVAWLVETEQQSRIYAKGRCCTGFGTMTSGMWLGQGDSIIASVYSLIDRLKTSRAAIAEVKRGKAD